MSQNRKYLLPAIRINDGEIISASIQNGFGHTDLKNKYEYRTNNYGGKYGDGFVDENDH